jgi:hypothetical protein
VREGRKVADLHSNKNNTKMAELPKDIDPEDSSVFFILLVNCFRADRLLKQEGR